MSESVRPGCYARKYSTLRQCAACPHFAECGPAASRYWWDFEWIDKRRELEQIAERLGALWGRIEDDYSEESWP